MNESGNAKRKENANERENVNGNARNAKKRKNVIENANEIDIVRPLSRHRHHRKNATTTLIDLASHHHRLHHRHRLKKTETKKKTVARLRQRTRAADLQTIMVRVRLPSLAHRLLLTSVLIRVANDQRVVVVTSHHLIGDQNLARKRRKRTRK